MKVRSILLFLFITIIVNSCDRASTLTYKIKNIAADSIRIVTVRKNGSVLIPDTFKISYNETITIGVFDKGSDHVSNYKQTRPAIEDFQTVDIYKVSTGARARTNFLQSGLWSYEEKSSRMAEYTATVKDTDF